ncbi:MAG: GNAT family N-acetyltransferase [Clostridiales bacterium]|nr:GNAT family N-acetyltransferase [Clostridiales bacterium]
MVKLVPVTEGNWYDIARLSLEPNQQKYLDRPIGIIARGYVYRDCNGKVFGIEADGKIAGVLFVRDMDEEPACYDLQQFMIGSEHQKKGYGFQALKLILEMLGKERRYECVEVCVNRENRAALGLFRKAGFTDTGYIDEDLPDCLNLIYRF